MTLLGELLDNGFSLEQSIHFMMMVSKKQKGKLRYIEKRLLKGDTLAKSLETLGFTKNQLAPLRFAEIHGDMVSTLKRMSKQMSEKGKQQKDMLKILSYPVTLLLFLVLMLIGMKQFIIPQLSSLSMDQESSAPKSFAWLDQGLRWGSLSILVGLLTFFLIIKYLGKKSEVIKMNFLAKTPIVGKLVTSYYTALFATEWGNLLSQGMTFKSVVLVMEQDGYSPLMQEMAREIQREIERGYFMNEPMKQWHFLTPELTLIIRQGEVNGRLGEELVMYGKKEWETFISEGEKIIQYLQPMTFILIAVLIVSIYGSLLLPIYGGMGEFY